MRYINPRFTYLLTYFTYLPVERGGELMVDMTQRGAERRQTARTTEPRRRVDAAVDLGQTLVDPVNQLADEPLSRRQTDQPPRRRPHRPRLYNIAVVGRGDQYNTIRYDTIRYDTRCYFNVRSKADISLLNLPHGTDN